MVVEVERSQAGDDGVGQQCTGGFSYLTGKCMGALHYAKLTGHRSVGIADENGTTFSD